MSIPNWIYGLILAILILCCCSCSVGVKEKQTVVYAGFSKDEAELRGAIKIATNKPIQITVVGEKTIVTTKDLGGMIVVREADLKALYLSYKEHVKCPAQQ